MKKQQIVINHMRHYFNRRHCHRLHNAISFPCDRKSVSFGWDRDFLCIPSRMFSVVATHSSKYDGYSLLYQARVAKKVTKSNKKTKLLHLFIVPNKCWSVCRKSGPLLQRTTQLSLWLLSQRNCISLMIS